MLNKPNRVQKLAEDCQDFLWEVESGIARTVPRQVRRTVRKGKQVAECLKQKARTSRDLAQHGWESSRDVARDYSQVARSEMQHVVAASRGAFHEGLQTSQVVLEEAQRQAVSMMIRDPEQRNVNTADSSSRRNRETTDTEHHVEHQDTETLIRNEIRSLERDLQSNEFVVNLNNSLQRHAPRGGTEATVDEEGICLPTAADLIEYYQGMPDLKTFTMEKELQRMDYTLYTKEGKKLTKTDDIIQYERERSKQQGTQEEEEEEETMDLLWRAANQSLFADVIVQLTRETALIRPHLHCATAVSDVSMVIDLACDCPHVRGECFLNLSIPCEYDESDHDVMQDRSVGRLDLAGVVLSVYFCPDMGQFKARILYVFPCQSLSDDQVTTAVEGLVERYSGSLCQCSACTNETEQGESE